MIFSTKPQYPKTPLLSLEIHQDEAIWYNKNLINYSLLLAYRRSFELTGEVDSMPLIIGYKSKDKWKREKEIAETKILHSMAGRAQYGVLNKLSGSISRVVGI